MYRSLIALTRYVTGARHGKATPVLCGSVRTIPEPLAEALRAGECFLFVGEGASGLGRGTWPEYMKALIQRLADESALSPEDAARLRDMCADHKCHRAAQRIRSRVSRADRYAVEVAEAMYAGPAVPNPALAALAGLPLRAAVTPNVDANVEEALGFDAIDPGEALAAEDRLAEGIPFVLKLRGTAGHRSLQPWQDVAMEAMNPYCAETIRELFATGTMLAAGVAANDLHGWLRAAGVSRGERPHYLVVETTHPELKRNADRLHRMFGVQVLALAAGEIIPFLRRLAPRAAHPEPGR
jgi:hypothetical protein